MPERFWTPQPYDDPVKARIARAWHLAWNEGLTDALDEIHARQFWRLDPHTGASTGSQHMRQTILSTRAAFGDIDTRITRFVLDGPEAAVLWRAAGTHTGSLLGEPPTGKNVALYGSTFMTLDEGLIADEIVTWNPRELLTAAGIRFIDTTQEV